MRLNKFLAENTELSRRSADSAIENGRVKINGAVAALGQQVNTGDVVYLDGKPVISAEKRKTTTILINKPVGYVCSKNGQGSKTVYDLLPEEYKQLNIAGRLDKDSSGLVILTNDGNLLNELTHPSNKKEKVYEITLEKPLETEDIRKIKKAVDIGDRRPSTFTYVGLKDAATNTYSVTLEEGRNRQIRRTISALDNEVRKLRRISHGDYDLESIGLGKFKLL